MADHIHVCALSDVPGRDRAGAGARISSRAWATAGSSRRRSDIMDGRHLKLVMHDIDEQRDGYTPPERGARGRSAGVRRANGIARRR